MVSLDHEGDPILEGKSLHGWRSSLFDVVRKGHRADSFLPVGSVLSRNDFDHAGVIAVGPSTSQLLSSGLDHDFIDRPKKRGLRPVGAPFKLGEGRSNTQLTIGPDTGVIAKPWPEVITDLCNEIHADNVRAGWWTDPATGVRKERNIGEILMLIVSEVAEGMEGHRKNLMDDKLPHRKMLEVELADAVIRICDLAGSQGFDLGEAIAEKRDYNATRADHKIEARMAPGGKSY